MATGLINIKFGADLKGFSSGIQNANRSIQKMGKKLQKVGKTLSIGVTTPFVAFSAVALKNFDAQDKAIAQVNQGLQSTGRYTDELSKKLQAQASVLQENSLFGDEDILQNSTAQILSFTNISVDKIGRVNQVVADLSTRLKVDLKSSAIQLSKALNDPIANLSALSRSGIQFSVDQKAMIKSLVETNRLAEAQNIILTELETQYGGSAKAAAEAGTGWLKQLSNSIGDLTEDFGKHINIALKPFAASVKNVVKSIQKWSPETKKMALVIGGLAAALGPLLVALGFLMTTVVPGLITSFRYLRASMLLVQTGFLKLTAIIASNPFGALAVAIAAIGSYFVFFNREIDKTIQKQTLLSQINDTAAKSIANEKAKLAELLAVARHEGVSKEQRLKAIKELNAISPKFLSGLSLETINTDTARIAVEKYNAELLKTAKVKAAQAKLQKIHSAKIDIEIRESKKLVSDAKKLKQLKADAVTIEDRLRVKTLEKIGYGKVSNGIHSAQLKQLQQEEDLLLKIITANQTKNKVVSTKPIVGSGRRKVSVIGSGLKPKGISLDIANPLDVEAEKVEGVLSKINTSFVNFSEQTSQIISNTVVNALAGFGEMIAGLASGSLTLGDVAGGLMQIIGGLATQLGKAAIEIGVGMLAIKAAFANPFTAIAAGIGLVAIGALISSAASITSGQGNFAGAFANGGIAGSGTGIVGGTSFSGDKLFARINSGEMVLNQRQQRNVAGLIGGGNTQAPQITLIPSIDFSGDKFRVMLNQVDKNRNRRM